MSSASQDRPLVSVVVPCYNAEAFVAETLESVLAQSYPAVELIVVDDHSTDNSWQVVQQYSDRLTAIRLPENRKGSHTRNRGAERARGEFLMFLDADDVIAPDTLQALVDAVQEVPGGIAVCRWTYLVKKDEGWETSPTRVPFPRADADHLAGWLEGAWVPPCGVLWRREVYDRTGGWDETLTGDDDGDIMMRALKDGARLVPAKGGQAFYRLHTGSTVSVSIDVRGDGNFRSRMRVLEKLTAALEAEGRFEQYKVPIGIQYYRLVPVGYASHRELARECARRGRLYAGRRAVSNRLPGRILDWLFGVEGKERVALMLERLGFVPLERRGRAAQNRKRKPSGDAPHGVGQTRP